MIGSGHMNNSFFQDKRSAHGNLPIFQDQILIMFGATVNQETFALSKEYFIYISIEIPFFMFG